MRRELSLRMWSMNVSYYNTIECIRLVVVVVVRCVMAWLMCGTLAGVKDSER